jgi:hypothetical protein
MDFTEEEFEQYCIDIGKHRLSYGITFKIVHTLNESQLLEFYNALVNDLKDISNISYTDAVQNSSMHLLPQYTSVYGLPEFVALELTDEGVKALYNLGFRAGKKNRILHPDGRSIDYRDALDKTHELYDRLKNARFLF